jgi:pyruvate dehydrogenase E1 component alpha subunit
MDDITLQNYRLMLLIRRFEETVEKLFTEGTVRGTTHPSIGQEAVPVGVCAALGPDDYVTSTHRGHGHFLARGADPKRMMAELFGKATGYSSGRGGSQLMADYGIGFLGANGITGGNIPTATGAAFSAKYLGQKRVAACFFGDGAANQGTFHESANLAGIWNLPVLFICENNQYAMSTHVRAATAVENIADRAAGYGIPGEVVDGNDLPAVAAATRAARARALEGGGPTLIECKTYRMSGHSRGDPRRYRSREEEERARANDPLRRMAKALLENGMMDANGDESLRQAVSREVEAAVEFAGESPVPEVASIRQGVFA